jgi:hypothetical protein
MSTALEAVMRGHSSVVESGSQRDAKKSSA